MKSMMTIFVTTVLIYWSFQKTDDIMFSVAVVVISSTVGVLRGQLDARKIDLMDLF